ncbi:hypothetical protein MMC34_000287 [Xylographa carneopallida]|nr:hypothetical protein [Xylographa carneopallida]
MATAPFPPSVHISQHPCLQAKLSQLRSKSTTARETKALVHEIALILGCEALATGLQTESRGTDETPLGYSYTTTTLRPSRISLVPILRSGLGMVDALTTLLPPPTPVHHLGLFRDPSTLQPVEYYNNLPYHDPSPPRSAPDEHLAILIDPIIATGGTAAAAIQTLREWGVTRILLLAVLGSEEGVRRAAAEWEGGVQVWVGGVDGGLDARGMIRPGVGDVGDRLFLTRGR